jgi:hypothetical protein
VTGGWIKRHNEELQDLYALPSIIRMIKLRSMRWSKHVAQMREKRNAYRLLVRKLEGWGPLGRPRRGWVGSIKKDLGEIGWSGVDWICLAQDRDNCRTLVNVIMNFWVP